MTNVLPINRWMSTKAHPRTSEKNDLSAISFSKTEKLHTISFWKPREANEKDDLTLEDVYLIFPVDPGPYNRKFGRIFKHKRNPVIGPKVSFNRCGTGSSFLPVAYTVNPGSTPQQLLQDATERQLQNVISEARRAQATSQASAHESNPNTRRRPRIPVQLTGFQERQSADDVPSDSSISSRMYIDIYVEINLG